MNEQRSSMDAENGEGAGAALRGAAAPSSARAAAPPTGEQKPDVERRIADAVVTELDALPKALAEREALALKARREAVKLGSEPSVGIGVSGGGIRSATFALGVFQALARGGLLRHVDWLSTVSGGGYFGAFLGALYARCAPVAAEERQADAEPAPSERVDERVAKKLADDADPSVRYLRDNGRYLAPGGTPDLFLAGAVLLRNWVALQLLFATFLLMVFLAAEVVERFALVHLVAMREPAAWLAKWWLDDGVVLSPWLLLVAAGVVAAALPLGWSYWTLGRGKLPRWFGALQGPVQVLWAALPNLLFVAACAVVVAETHPRLATVVVWLATLALAMARLADCRPGWVLWLPYPFALALLFFAPSLVDLEAGDPGVWLSAFAALVLGFSLVVHPLARRVEAQVEASPALSTEAQSELSADNRARHRVSLGLKTVLVSCAVLLGFALVDTIGRSLYVHWAGDTDVVLGVSGGILTLLWAAATSARRLVVKFASPGADGKRPTASLGTLAWLAAVLLVATVLSGASFAAKGFTWEWNVPQNVCPAAALERSVPTGCGVPDHLLWALGVAFVVSLLFGSSRVFLNRSTHLPLYSARLTRTYLGASNPHRLESPPNPMGGPDGDEPDPRAATRVMPGDDLPAATYWGWGWSGKDEPPASAHWAKGAPLHVVNVTINETVDGRSRSHQSDRRGLLLAVGPCAISVGKRHHLLPGRAAAVEAPPDEFRVFRFGKAYRRVMGGENEVQYPREQLTLGQWMSISGAAISTGLGSRTNQGLSLLAGFANVRLGHWWRPGTDWNWSLRRALGSLFWVQTYLFRELVALFPGTQNALWYLSDGGHFENLGGYELIRRRLGFVILIDGEADPKYELEGLGNLVRKARLDFGAEIEFIDPKFAMPGLPVGPLHHLRRGEWRKDGKEWSFQACEGGRSLARAAFARVRYADEKEDQQHWLLYIKAVVLEGMPADLEHYSCDRPAFPHESTGDQFFDEAQWESYRKLGELTGEELFGHAVDQPAGELVRLLRGMPRRGSGRLPVVHDAAHQLGHAVEERE